MVASKDSTFLNSHTLATGIKAIPKVIRSAAIYGPNASGKSNVVLAISYMTRVVAESASLQADQTFNVKPFQLDPKTKDQPSEFEITFIKDSIRYQYGFKMKPERITEEWLLVYKSSKPQLWFNRKFDNGKNVDEYEFGPKFTGQKELWKKSTRPNALFLSTAIQLNNTQMKPIYDWLTQDIVYFGAGNTHPFEFTTQLIQTESGRQEVINFLLSADISINNVSVKKTKGFKQRFQFGPNIGKQETFIEDAEILLPQFHHETSTGSAVFELIEESLGTQRLYALAGPFIDILNKGKVLIFDELDSSLHTLLARRIVNLFNSDKNKNGSQLIFTTHDTSLLHSDVIRRDQVWFIEKDSSQSSNLYPLTDFSPRKNESFERGYLIGRYGAVPFFSDFEM